MGCLKLICALHLVYVVLVVVSEGHAWTIRVNYRTEKIGSLQVPTVGSAYELRTARIHPFQIFYPYFPEKIDNGVGVGGKGSSSSSSESMTLNNETDTIENLETKSNHNIPSMSPLLATPSVLEDGGDGSGEKTGSSEEDGESDESSSSSSSSSSEEEGESGSGEVDQDKNNRTDNSNASSSEEGQEGQEDDCDDEDEEEENETHSQEGGEDDKDEDEPDNEEISNVENHDTESPDISLPALPGLPGFSDWKGDLGENFVADLLTGLDFLEIASHVFELVVDMNDDDEKETSSTTEKQNFFLDEKAQEETSSSNPLSFVLRLPTAANITTAPTTTTSTTTTPTTTTPTTTTEKLLNDGPSVVTESRNKKMANESQDVSVLEIFYPRSGIEIKSFAAGTTLTIAFCALLLLLWRLTKNRSGKVIQHHQQQQLPEAPPMYDLKH